MPRVKEFINRIISFIKSHKKVLLIFIPIIAITLFLLLRPKNSNTNLTEEVKRQDVVKTVSVTGNVNAENYANMSFLTAGKLVYLGAKEGDSIKKGSTIATLDTRTVAKNLQNALIDYSKQRNTFDQSLNDHNAGGAVDATNDTVKRVLQNNQFDLDKAVNSVELQELAKENSFLISPIDGILTKMDVKTVGANVTATNVFTVVDPTSLDFAMEVDEADIGLVKDGQSVKLNLDSYPNEDLNLQVDSIDFVSHKTSSGGNAFYVKANLPETQDKFRVGMSGNADIIIKKESNVLAVSSSSITEDGYVYVKSGDKFVKTKVEKGLESDILVEILSGLNEGDEVALDPTSLPKNKIK